MSYHGNPCWYELATTPGKLDDAGRFYEKVLGWNVADAGMEGFDYHLAQSGVDTVAGLMSMPGDVSGMPPFWMIYFAVDDIDQFMSDATEAGASVHRDVAEIPGTGRFALLADPQGVGFGVLQPEPMTPSAEGHAFDQNKAGHGNWNELMTPDPEGGFAFYSKLFGWTKGEAMDMGEMGTYQLIRRDGKDIGAIQSQGSSPVPAWLPYFGVDGSVSAKVETIKAAGGQIHHGPAEVPGPAYIAIAQDAQGAAFAVVGPEK